MTSIDILGAQASVRTYDVLTTGMVGATVEFRFDKSWDNLVRTAVFRQGAVTKDVVNIGTTAKIPPEVLMIPGLSVKIGVLGTNSDGTVVIPTVWAETRPVKDGTDPSGDESADPTLPVWEQILATIGDMHSLSTEAKGNLVASINELVQLCEDGTVDAEYIQQEVEKYLKENPVTETDPTVPAWAKQPEKPKYTAQEVGALPADTVIPTIPDNVSAFRNDAGYLTEHQDLTGYATERYVQGYAQPKGDYLTAIPDGYAKTEDIPTKPEDIGAQPAGNYALKTDIPSVPVRSVNGKIGAVSLSASDVGARPSNWMPTAQEVGALPDTYVPPDQTAAQVGADPAGTAESAVSTHNTSTDAHNDLRLELKAINDRLNAFFDSDDKTLDELSEIVAYITSNKALIDSITTSKVSVGDIIDNLTTNVTNKPLSAAQGVVLKGLIDGLSTGKLDANKLQEAINTALAQAKASGEFDGKDGQDGSNGKDGTSVTVKSVSESNADGGSKVVTFSDGKTVTIKNGSKGNPYTLTNTDKAAIVSAVISELPVYAGEVL